MVQNVRFGPEGSRLAGANLEKRGTRLRASGSSPEAGGVGGGTWGHVVRCSKCVVKPVSVRNGKPGKASNGERRDCC
jgi:hypothetical protein